METVYITDHALKRGKERLGIKPKAMKRQFQLALERGYKQNQLKGHLSKWATKQALSSYYAHAVCIYNGHAFIYDPKENVLVTVYIIPQELLRHISDYIILGD